MIKLKSEFKEKWVAALRSGDWVPFPGSLGEIGTNRRCCLGVALEVLGVPSRDSDTADQGILIYGHNAKALPTYSNICAMATGTEYVREAEFMGNTWQLWVTTDFPRYAELRKFLTVSSPSMANHPNAYISLNTSLTNLNDAGCSFDMIADLIEFYG